MIIGLYSLIFQMKRANRTSQAVVGNMVWNEKVKRDIPASWKTKAIEDIADVYNGATPSTVNEQNYGRYCLDYSRKIYLTRNKKEICISQGENAIFRKPDIILAVLIYCLKYNIDDVKPCSNRSVIYC